MSYISVFIHTLVQQINENKQSKADKLLALVTTDSLHPSRQPVPLHLQQQIGDGKLYLSITSTFMSDRKAFCSVKETSQN